MECPQCKNSPLEPSEIEPGLVAASCGSCNGVLLALMNYRFWLDRGGAPANDAPLPDDTAVEDSTQAKLCPIRKGGSRIGIYNCGVYLLQKGFANSSILGDNSLAVFRTKARNMIQCFR